MKMKSLMMKRALLAVVAASAFNAYSADTPAAADLKVDFPKAGLELWLSAGQVE